MCLHRSQLLGQFIEIIRESKLKEYFNTIHNYIRFRQELFEKSLDIHLPLLDSFLMMVVYPATRDQCLLKSEPISIFEFYELLNFEKLAETDEYLLSDHLHFDLNNIDRIFQHLVIAFCGAQYPDFWD